MTGKNDDKAMLIFHDWVDTVEELPAEEFKELFLCIRDFQRDGTVRELTGGAKIAAGFILPTITRYRESQENGRKAHAKKKTALPPESTPEEGLQPPCTPLPAPCDNKDKDKDKDKTKNKSRSKDDDKTKDKTKDNDGAEAASAGPSSSSESEEEKTQKVFHLYAQRCPSLVPADSTNARLQQEVRQALRSRTTEELRSLFEKAESTPFLRGEGEKGWRASLSWLLQHADRVLSGEYAPYTPSAPPAAVRESSFDVDEFFRLAMQKSYGTTAASPLDSPGGFC